MKKLHTIRICSLLISFAVLAAGCSQAVSSSASVSSESSSVSVSSSASSPESAASSSSAASVSSESAAVSVSSQSSSESVASSVPVSSESSELQKEAEWWEEFLDSDLGAVLTEMRYYDSSRKISVGANYFEFSKQTDSGDLGLIRDTAEPVTLEELGEPLTGISSFEVLIAFDTKYTGKFYENGIALTKSEPNEEAGEPVYLSIGEEDYQELLSRCEDNFASEGCGKYPSWLTIMRLYKLDSIVGTCDNGETIILDIESGERYNVWRYLRDICVEPDSAKTVTVDSKLSNCETILVNFINGIQYQIQINKTSILIASSDMSYALKYTLEGNRRERYMEALDADNWDYYENPVTG